VADVVLLLNDPTLGKHLGRLVARLGRSWCCVPSLAEAIEASRRSERTTIVLDLDLVGSDPAAAARALRCASPDARLVALDSLCEHRAGAGRPLPFDAVIPKPFIAQPLADLLASAP